jgi:hypothetical protein
MKLILSISWSGFKVGAYLIVYMISHYLNFLKEVSILTLYTSLDASTLNHNHNFI